MTEQQMFCINSVDLTRSKDRDHLIPPIIPLEREESEICDNNYQPAAQSSLFDESSVGANGTPSFNQLNNSAFQTVTPATGSVPGEVNAMTFPIISSVGSYAPSPINTMTSCVPFVASQGGWPMPPPNSIPALPSSATVPPFAATGMHNPAIVIAESPQLHAALTMGCLPGQNFPEPYGNFLHHHQQGLPTPNQQTNFIPFPPMSIGMPTNLANSGHHAQGAPESIQHHQQHIEISGIRNAKEQESAEIEESDNSRDISHHDISEEPVVSFTSTVSQQETPRDRPIPPPRNVPPLAEDRDTMVTSTSAMSSPEGHLASPPSNHNGGSREGSLETPDQLGVNTSENGDGDRNYADSQDQVSRHSGKEKSSRPAKRQAVTAGDKDTRYYDKRRRNNQSAKRSRDARKEREDSVSRRADFLERENSILKAQLATLKEEANSLRQIIAQRPIMTNLVATNQLQ